jgi:uncharacterized protein
MSAVTATVIPAARARQTLPDLLRGIALLGIVIVNAPFLGISPEGFTAASTESVGDAGAAFIVIALAQGKFYLLFAFLFGYSTSFVLRGDRPEGRRRYGRRIVALAVLGVLHAALLFVGDILLSYAVLGLLLLLVSRRSDARLRRLVVGVFVLGTVFIVALMWFAAAFPESAAPSSRFADALATGDFVTATLARLEALPETLLFVLVAQGTFAFAAFILGLLASRQQLLADPAAHPLLWRRLLAWGIGLGLPLQVVAAALVLGGIRADDPLSAWSAAGTALGFATAPLLAAGYVALVALLVARRPTALSWLWPAGRVTLTVYLSQSLLLSLLFSGYGLGFFGQWGALAVVASGLASWVLLVAWANLWLRRFERGPLEALVARWSQPKPKRA